MNEIPPGYRRIWVEGHTNRWREWRAGHWRLVKVKT